MYIFFCDTVDTEGLVSEVFSLFFAICLLFSESDKVLIEERNVVGCALFSEEVWNALEVTVCGCVLT